MGKVVWVLAKPLKGWKLRFPGILKGCVHFIYRALVLRFFQKLRQCLVLGSDRVEAESLLEHDHHSSQKDSQMTQASYNNFLIEVSRDIISSVLVGRSLRHCIDCRKISQNPIYVKVSGDLVPRREPRTSQFNFCTSLLGDLFHCYGS